MSAADLRRDSRGRVRARLLPADEAAIARLREHLAALLPGGKVTVDVVEYGDEYQVAARSVRPTSREHFAQRVASVARAGTAGDAICEAGRMLGVLP